MECNKPSNDAMKISLCFPIRLTVPQKRHLMQRIDAQKQLWRFVLPPLITVPTWNGTLLEICYCLAREFGGKVFGFQTP